MSRPFRFTPPELGAGVVARRRLLSVLARRWEQRLVTIEASAGFGKTTLLAQSLAENALDPRGRDVWLTAEPADASPSNLLAALLTALGSHDADQLPTVEAVHDAVWTAAPQQVCLCIDDAHVIGPASDGGAVLEQLVDGLPENAHVLLAGRAGTRPSSARLHAQGRALHISEADLRFDAAELADLASRHDVALADLEGAGGWPALSTLWATTGREHAGRFVAEEVLDQLAAPDRRAFVVAVAVGGGDARVIEAATGDGVDLDALRDVPLVASEGGAIRPHALWEDLLRGELATEDVAAARRLAAAALRARGDAAPAFELLASAHDWDAGLVALFDACNDQQHPPWRDSMERWRALVPNDVAHRPEVAYLDALIEREIDPWSQRCSELFDAAIAGFFERGDLVGELVSSVRAGYSYWLRGDAARLERMVVRGAEMAAAGLPVAPILMLNAAVRDDIVGDDDALLALRDLGPADEPRLRHFPPLFRTLARLAIGDIDGAFDDAATASACAARVWPAAGTGWATIVPTLVAWSRGDAMEPGTSLLADPGPRLGVGERSLALTLSTVVRANCGDDEGAEADLARLLHLAAPGPRPGLVSALIAVATATVAAARGDEATATTAFTDELGDAPLDRVGAGRVATWFPAVTWLHCARARPMLEAGVPHGLRATVVHACRCLVDARDGKPIGDVALLARPDALAAALPTPAAVELAVHAVAAGDARGTAAAQRLIERAPVVARRTLRTLANGDRPEVARAAGSVLGSVAIPPASTLRIEVLGAARLLRDGVPVESADLRRERVRHVLLALVLHREIRRERLGVLLWPDFDEDTVSANMRTTLTYVQRLLEPDRVRGDAPWYVRQDAGALVLGGGASLEVDLWEFDAALAAGRDAVAAGSPSLELDHLLRAVGLYRGTPFEDLADVDWASSRRDTTQAELVDAACRASELLANGRRPAEAARVASIAVAAGPWSERAFRALAAAQLASGHESAAANTLDRCERALDDLGATPTPALAELRARLTHLR